MSSTETTNDKPIVTNSPANDDSGATKDLSATSVTLCLSALLSSLDLTIVTTAVPAIVTSF
ncbi:hypothetical protein RRF57_011017 [Xylaria bambusicola]|uniref:Uncharacterized protein n=1 Tax=Xylaria bambusicola TaxID=326684 RepID=A0AAN7UM34_9PEZI